MRTISFGQQFIINIAKGKGFLQFRVIKCFDSPTVEHFIVIAPNKCLLLRSNRPVSRAQGEYLATIKWSVIAGEVKNQQGLESIISSLNDSVVFMERN